MGKTLEDRQAAYRQLFKHHVSEESANTIREATNKAWVLGSDRFKQRIQKQLERRVEPAVRGGDRKSVVFKNLATANTAVSSAMRTKHDTVKNSISNVR